MRNGLFICGFEIKDGVAEGCVVFLSNGVIVSLDILWVVDLSLSSPDTSSSLSARLSFFKSETNSSKNPWAKEIQSDSQTKELNRWLKS